MHRHLPAGSEVDSHHHDEHQIVYASRGVLSIVTAAGTWVAPANRALWIPAGTPHEHRAYGPTDLHSVGLPVTDNPLRLATPAVLAVSPLLRELIVAYSATPADRSPARQRLYRVLVDQLESAPPQAFHLPAATDGRLASVCAILRDNPADNRSLAELGAAVGAGGRTLTRLFRTELGMTFPQWRTQLRLHHALILLAGNDSVTAVAHRCGWSSASARPQEGGGLGPWPPRRGGGRAHPTIPTCTRSWPGPAAGWAAADRSAAARVRAAGAPAG